MSTTTTSGGTAAASSKSFEIAALLFVGVLWGAQFAFNKIQLETVPPFTGVAARLWIAALFLWVIVWVKGLAVPSGLGAWRNFTIQGLLTSGGPGVMVLWGQQYVASALAAILNSTTPIFATIVTLLITRHERIGGQKVIGLVVGLGGVVLVVGIDALRGIDKGLIGQIVIVLSALGYGSAAVFGRRFSGISPVVTAAAANSCSATVMTAVAFLMEQPLAVAPSARSATALIVSAVLCNGIAVILYYRLIATLGSIGASSLGYLKAAFGVLIGCLILGEPLTAAIVIGFTAVMIGVAAINEQLPGFARRAEAGR
jgi:drug/metabolite transporter (DMT)-like permease